MSHMNGTAKNDAKELSDKDLADFGKEMRKSTASSPDGRCTQLASGGRHCALPDDHLPGEPHRFHDPVKESGVAAVPRPPALKLGTEEDVVFSDADLAMLRDGKAATIIKALAAHALELRLALRNAGSSLAHAPHQRAEWAKLTFSPPPDT